MAIRDGGFQLAILISSFLKRKLIDCSLEACYLEEWGLPGTVRPELVPTSCGLKTLQNHDALFIVIKGETEALS